MITLEQAKQLLGDEALALTDNQIMQMVENLQVLAKQWNEAYQKSIFNGQTVDQLLTGIQGGSLS